jgi:hypothetical protein
MSLAKKSDYPLTRIARGTVTSVFLNIVFFKKLLSLYMSAVFQNLKLVLQNRQTKFYKRCRLGKTTDFLNVSVLFLHVSSNYVLPYLCPFEFT